MHRTYAIISLALLAAAPSPAQQAPVPEVQIDAFLPALIAGLKRNLPDAYSVRDLTVCEASKVKLTDGRPTGWVVQLALNSRTTAGGYGGLTAYTAMFKEGRVNAVYSTGQPSADPLNGLIYKAIMKRIARCRPIPQVQVQALLEAAPAL